MNKENYKKAIDQIKASEELKRKTFQNIKQKEKRTISIHWREISTACAVCMIMLFVVTFYLKENSPYNVSNIENIENKENVAIANVQNNDLPRFENIEQLKKILEKNSQKRSLINKEIMTDSATIGTAKTEQSENKYSKTNVQVEGVDEADTVKTDGEYIYYVTNGNVYIFNSTNLKIASKIEYEDNDKSRFYPQEIYIYHDKLVVLGNGYEHIENTSNDEQKKSAYVRINTDYMAKAIVYDISDKKNPKELRQVSLDGNYSNSRMIGENLYFISSKSPYYYKNMEDKDILPLVRDTASKNKEKRIACTDIAYFRDTDNYSFMIVAGFNINNNDDINTETFFGANDTIYASQDNLYITQTIYKDGFFSSNCKSEIYKFNLKDSEVKLQCKGEVKGDLKNQFSIDEYEDNLRIATTNNNGDKSTNQLYILDNNLEQIGKIEGLAKGEQIYSVRFVGKIGYVVTFKEIDPLFVIDLSNPKEPKVKGKLKIPGYSSYLHPYDETHIIGIGYDTKSNGYGGITNSNMKMSMFDVSDLENPKEMFNIKIGNNYAYSDVIDNHKALFYHKDKDLIGFPITYREYQASKDKNGFVLFKINLNKGFEKYGEILQEIDYKTNIDRAIYIENTLYTLSETKIVSYDLNTTKKLNEAEY
ncbi:MAG: hypothetical protein HFJ17_06335 [Clostridia bacterium]|nr:hypothetical protein [Clostridia bacterium]